MSIRVCFSGGSGHSGSVVAALPKLLEVELRGFCRTYPEEAMKAVSPLGLKEYSTLEEMLDQEAGYSGVGRNVFPSWSRRSDRSAPRNCRLL